MSCWESFLLCQYVQGFSPLSTIKLIESVFILKSLIQLEHKFCTGCWVWIYFHSSTQRHPVVLASFVEDLVFFPVWISGFFIKNTWCKGLAFSSSGTEVEPQSQRTIHSIFLSEEEKQFSGAGKRVKLVSLNWLQRETLTYTHLQGFSISFIFQTPFLYSSQQAHYKEDLPP